MATKRKRSANGVATKKAPKRSKRAGYTRTGGFYGRFAGKNAELKFFDTAFAAFTFDTTGEILPGGGTATSINLVPQGTTESTRIGRKIVIKKISIKGMIKYPTLSGTALTPILRMALVLDKQANGAYPAWSDIYSSDEPYSFLNLANSQRFVIMKDWFFTLAPTGGAYDGTNDVFVGQAKIIKYNKSCNLPIEFNSTTGAITEIRSNNLFLVADAKLMDDQVEGWLNTRIRYSDS